MVCMNNISPFLGQRRELQDFFCHFQKYDSWIKIHSLNIASKVLIYFSILEGPTLEAEWGEKEKCVCSLWQGKTEPLSNSFYFTHKKVLSYKHFDFLEDRNCLILWYLQLGEDGRDRIFRSVLQKLLICVSSICPDHLKLGERRGHNKTLGIWQWDRGKVTL